MSKIQKELLEVTELSTKRGEAQQDLLSRLVKAVADLSDKEWDSLSKEAQDWYNDAADAKNAKAKSLPDFPDVETAEADEEEKPKARRGAAKEEPAKPKVGAVAKVTTKRGKSSTGTIVELDDEVIVLKMGDGSEEEFDRSRVESIELASEVKGGHAAKEDEPEDDPIKVGASVVVTTKRGKEVAGKIVELDDEVIVLDVDGKDEEFARDRVESIKPAKAAKGKPEADEEEKPKARRGAAKEEEAEDKPKRSSNGGVSIGQRIRELMCEDTAITEEGVAKIMKKEGLEFRDTSLKMIFKDTTAVFALLKAAKKLK